MPIQQKYYRWRIALFIFLLLPSACGLRETINNFVRGEDNAIAPTPLVHIENPLTLPMQWKERIGELTLPGLRPTWIGGQLFITTPNGEVSAIDAHTGKRLWRQELAHTVTAGIGTTESLLLLGTNEGDVLALAQADGQLQWQAQVGSEILSAPVGTDRLVVVRSADGKITSFNAASGERLWHYNVIIPALTLRGTSPLTTSEDLIISGFANGRIVFLEKLTGKLVGELEITTPSGRTELDRLADIDATPLLVDDIIYAAAFQGPVTALNINSGDEIWSRHISVHLDLAADEQQLYLTAANDHVYALDRTTGDIIWQQQQLTARKLTAPVLYGDLLLVGDTEGYLHLLDKTTGDLLGRLHVSEVPINIPPLVVDSWIYVYASDGTLAAYAQP